MNPGFLLIDKPAGITSHDVIARLRRLTGVKRIGHAGTLDPFATGLLLVGVGREATREMQKLVGLDKTYETTFVLGASSTTDDVTGIITYSDPSLSPLFARGKEALSLSLQRGGYGWGLNVLQSFIGEIDQVPPTYAAIKVGGKKLYELARAGKPTLVEPRRVTIYQIELLSYGRATCLPAGRWPSVDLYIHCSSGTYIRAIARDLGAKLDIGGYVESLRRTTIGPFSIEKAAPLSSLTADNWKEAIVPIQSFLANL